MLVSFTSIDKWWANLSNILFTEYMGLDSRPSLFYPSPYIEVEIEVETQNK